MISDGWRAASDADRGTSSSTPSSPTISPAWMSASVGSVPCDEEVKTRIVPDATTWIDVARSPAVNSTSLRRSVRDRDALARSAIVVGAAAENNVVAVSTSPMLRLAAATGGM